MNNSTKLIISIIIDLLGMLSYLIPFIGSLSDIIFAPIQAAWIYYAYRTTTGAILGGVEELLPFIDVIPSCTIVHFMTLRKTTSS